ncbi:hypothetical protein U1Q18_041455 [Sarracenia purpurea var. burkii]
MEVSIEVCEVKHNENETERTENRGSDRGSRRYVDEAMVELLAHNRSGASGISNHGLLDYAADYELSLWAHLQVKSR